MKEKCKQCWQAIKAFACRIWNDIMSYHWVTKTLMGVALGILLVGIVLIICLWPKSMLQAPTAPDTSLASSDLSSEILTSFDDTSSTPWGEEGTNSGTLEDLYGNYQPPQDNGNQTETHASGITLSRTTLTLKQGQTAQIKATVYPETAENRNVIWSTNRSGVAEVSYNGTVTAMGIGTCTLTAQAEENSGIFATVTVTVTAAEQQTPQTDTSSETSSKPNQKPSTSKPTPSESTPAESSSSEPESSLSSSSEAESDATSDPVPDVDTSSEPTEDPDAAPTTR